MSYRPIIHTKVIVVCEHASGALGNVASSDALRTLIVNSVAMPALLATREAHSGKAREKAHETLGLLGFLSN